MTLTLAQRLGLAPAAALFLLALLSVYNCSPARADERPHPFGWREIAWPFPRDAWEPGLAFICSSEACDGDLALYVRPKLGFCNCTTGVSDDEEVDRVTDLDLVDPDFKPLGSGTSIAAGGMQGRARHYVVRLKGGSLRPIMGIALARKCDVVVALARSTSSHPVNEQIALELLSSPALQTWFEAELEGRR